MSVLSWLFIPIGATVLAMLVATVWGRTGPRRGADRYDQVEQFHRFCQAMEDETATRSDAERTKPITRTVE